MGLSSTPQVLLNVVVTMPSRRNARSNGTRISRRANASDSAAWSCSRAHWGINGRQPSYIISITHSYLLTPTAPNSHTYKCLQYVIVAVRHAHPSRTRESGDNSVPLTSRHVLTNRQWQSLNGRDGTGALRELDHVYINMSVVWDRDALHKSRG